MATKARKRMARVARTFSGIGAGERQATTVRINRAAAAEAVELTGVASFQELVERAVDHEVETAIRAERQSAMLARIRAGTESDPEWSDSLQGLVDDRHAVHR